MLPKSHSGMNYACMAFLLTDAIPLCRDSHITLFRANHNRVKRVLIFMAYILSQLGKSHIFILSVLFGMCALFVQLGASEGNAATYYVSTSGNDANPGTSDRPWRNLQKCAASPIRAGDTCIVRSGTYAAPSGKYVTINIGGSAPSGTSSQPITIKSEKTNGAVVIVPSTSYSLNAAFYVSRPYYIIEGFDITGGANNGSTVGFVGIFGTSSATGLNIRSNKLHHIARTVCTNSTYGNDGVYLDSTANVLIDQNRFYAIGRRRNGESGCVTNKFQHDHGVYANGSKSLTIRRNVFYDVNRGFPINIKGVSTSTTGLRIHHNTISGKSPTGQPAGQIAITNYLSDAQIRNNIFNDPPNGYVFWWYTTSSVSGLRIDYNLSNGTSSTIINPYLKPSSGITYTNNTVNLSPGFVNPGANDFRLTSSSPAINRGSSSGVPVVPDGLPDIAAYEYSLQNTISSPLTPTGITVQ